MLEPKPSTPVQLPQPVKVALSILTPIDEMEEYLEDLAELYERCIVPELGRAAPLWAYGQVFKAIGVLVKDTALEFIGRAKGNVRRKRTRK